METGGNAPPAWFVFIGFAFHFSLYFTSEPKVTVVVPFDSVHIFQV